MTVFETGGHSGGHPEWLESGEAFFHRHGGISIALGRFIGPIRPVIPVVAGMLGMPARYFYFINIISAVVWSPAYLLPGYFVGASLNWRNHAPMELLAVVAGVMAVALVLGFVLHYGLQWLRKSWSRRQLLWAGWAVSLVLFIGLSILVKTPAIVGLNHDLHSWLQPMRSGVMDQVFRFITSFGHRQVSIPVFVLMSWWLWRDHGVWRCAQFVVFSVVLEVVFVAISNTMAVPRPEGAGSGSFSFPSGHTTFGVFIVLWLGHYFSSLCRPSWRPWLWSVSFGAGGLLGFSRLYLGKHWLMDVSGGMLLASFSLLSWLLVVDYLSGNRRAEMQNKALSETSPDSSPELLPGSLPAEGSPKTAAANLIWWRVGQMLLVYLGSGLFLAYG